MQHALTQALGEGSRTVKPQVQRLQLMDGDCLLLCTDGLTNLVDDDQIAATLAGGEAAEATCRRLVELALERGGDDNVTVVVARFRFPQAG
jgi:protein phosphatase